MMVPSRVRIASRPATHRRILAVCAGLSGLIALPVARAQAAPPGDDWSLERDDDDPELIARRLSKLRKRPFDDGQWRTLVRTLGAEALAERIEHLPGADAGDLGVRILRARARWALGDPAQAAEALAAIEPEAGRLAGKVFDLRIEALLAADLHRPAIEALVARAETEQGRTRHRLLGRALTLAKRSRSQDAMLRIAKRLAAGKPRDPEAQLELARAAAGAGQATLADDAYGEVLEAIGPRRRHKILSERAHVRLQAGQATGAADLLWSLVSEPGRGSRSDRAQWWSWLVDAHRQIGSMQILQARLRRWLDGPGNRREPAAWRALAMTEDATGTAAIETWKTVIELDPGDSRSRAALVDALEAAGQLDEAIAQLRALLRRDPDAADTALDFANRLVSNGRRDLAMEIASDVEQRVRRRAEPLLMLLDFYNLNDEPPRALEVAKRLVRAYPRDPDARIALGEQLYQMNRAEEAMAQWGKLPRLLRPRHRGLARHAQVLSEHGRTHDAIRVLKRAIERSPEQPEYLRLMAVLKEENQRHAVALGYWESVREMAKDPDQRVLRDEARTRVVELLVSGGGDLPRRDRKLKIAMAKARRLLEAADPPEQAIEAGRFLAELYSRREAYAEAVAVQQQLLQLAPDDPERLAELAAAQRRAGQVTDAMHTLETLLQRAPDRSAQVLAQLSELAYEAGKAEKALQTATEAVKQDPTQVQALLHLGELHERQGDLDLAARVYRRALKTAPDHGRARLRLAELALTRGDVEGSSAMFRAILEDGGSAQLMREAGRRALDLAEATDTTETLLALAVDRTRVQPDADQPREFLLAALERARPRAIERWLQKGQPRGQRVEPRVAALRGPLVAALTRGSVGARLRAAEHLGRLGLPDTAVPLAQMGAQLSAPRDTTRTVREAFEQARVTAIVAAGELDDPRAVEIFTRLLEDPQQSRETRYAAAWALTRSSSEGSVQALLPHLRPNEDPLLVSLTCIAMARAPAEAIAPEHATRAARLGQAAKEPSVRHACKFAQAALTPDHRVERLIPQLESSDPTAAGIAAWRLGRLQQPPSDAVLEALLRRFLGPGGLTRDAAGAALARLLSPASSSPPAASLPPIHGGGWETVLERWLDSTIAPRYRPVPPGALAPHHGALKAAVRAAAGGTRAERKAVQAARTGCDEHGSDARIGGQRLCLVPLVDGAVTIPNSPAD